MSAVDDAHAAPAQKLFYPITVVYDGMILHMLDYSMPVKAASIGPGHLLLGQLPALLGTLSRDKGSRHLLQFLA
jgi:hypothetical protein